MTGLSPEAYMHSDLSPAELETLQLIMLGKSNIEISVIRGVSKNTTRAQVEKVFFKLGVFDRVSAVVVGLKRGILKLPDDEAVVQDPGSSAR